jgi:hypothetical protein
MTEPSSELFGRDELVALLDRLECSPGRLSYLIRSAARWPELWLAGRPIPPLFQQRLLELDRATALH